MMKPCAFLDRDGVLNRDHGYVHRPGDLEWMPGAPAAVKRLNDEGFMVVVVTNQSGVARGYFDEAAVHAFHAHMSQKLAENGARIDAFYHCPYHGEGTVEHYLIADHPDRKPNPGMILRALDDLPIRKTGSFLIGDSPSDIAAANSAGIASALFKDGDLDQLVADMIDHSKSGRF